MQSELSRFDLFPASRAQRQIFYVESITGAGSTYLVAMCYEVSGETDGEVLRRAVTYVVGRHEALHTHLTLVDEVLHQAVDLEWELDWRELTCEDEADFAARLSGETRRPFDLAAGPLVRAVMFRRAAADPVLLITMHHVVTDGWSVDVLLSEIATAYQAFAAGREPGLNPPDFQYGDYSIWQDAWLHSDGAARQLNHWRETLAGDLPVLSFDGIGEIEPGAAPGAAGTVVFPLPGGAVAALRAAARQCGATSFSALLAMFHALLRGYTGSEDVVVGVPVANRVRPEFARTVGFFVNTVAVRVRAAGDTTLAELIAAVHGAALDAYDNQEIPFEAVVQAVNPARSLDVHPIFQALFMAGDPVRPHLTAGTMTLSEVRREAESAKFPLTLQVFEQEDPPRAVLEYRADLIGPAWAHRFADAYRTVLEVAAGPGRRLADLPAVSPADRLSAGSGRRPEADPAPAAPPRDAVETELLRVWAEVLQSPAIGIDDNYFGAGGDSIRSTQILARSRAAGLQFSLRDLLTFQTVRELAPHVHRDETPAPRDPSPFALVTAADRAALPDDLADAYPMTAAQAGMIYHGELAGGQRVYHNVAHYDLRARYDAAAWRTAVRAVLARHEVLRTSLALDGFSVPLQLVHRRVPVPLTFEDLRDLDPDRRDARLRERFAEESEQGFDLATAPLIRFHLQRTGEDRMRLWVVEHHAIMDGFSARLLLGELLGEYADAMADAAAAAPAVPATRFRRLVELEQAAIADPAERAFWLEQLAGMTAATLPFHATGAPSVKRMAQFPLADDLSAGVSRLAAELSVPARLVLLTAHLRVMALLTGREDVVAGTVYNCRVEEPGGDRVIGLFLNTLPFRHRLRPVSWSETIRAVAETDLAIVSHRWLPMPLIQQEMGIAPLFDTFFNYTRFDEPADRTAEDVEILDQNAVVPTNFGFGAEFFWDSATSSVTLGLRYDTGRFTTDDVERIGGYYLRALHALVTDPSADVTRVQLLSEPESARLSAANDTTRRYERAHLLHVLLAEQARTTPGSPAVTFRDTTLSYGELDALANRLAHRLRAAGVGRGAYVGVCLPRSLEMVVGLIGVLKAGAAYVPLSPEDPDLRIRGALHEAGALTVLTTAPLARRLGDLAVPVEVIDAGDLGGWPESAPVTSVTPADPAYLIFTSGSTGRPKGVVVPHRAICNRLLWMQEEMPIGADDCVVQKTPFTFDVSLWEFFWPLMQGSRLVVAEPGGHRDPEYLAGLIQHERVTTVHFVPSMLRAFVDHGALQPGTSLRKVICSGEALTPELKDAVHARYDGELINLYGPTEAAVDATFWRCERQPGGPVLIGRPIANMRAHVLDPARQPLPALVTGELYLAGTGLADGYLGRPELTAEAFVDVDGERMYRTGDLVRRLPGGELEFLGRTDDQVKIRGFRVELVEIEAVLATQPEVGAVAVLADGDRLVAYVVAAAGRFDVAELRAFAADRLPEYMVPAHWHELAELPLSPSGKVDRARLPRPESVARDVRRVAEPPTTAVQRRLTAIWEDVLGVRPVGVNDSFFELGGHSLSALRLTMLVRREFDRRVPVADLLANNTVAKLERFLQGGPDDGDGDGARIVPIRRAGNGEPLLLIHPVGGGVFCYLPLAAALGSHRPVFGLIAEGLVSGGVTNASVEEIAASYVRLIDTRQATGPYHLGGWSFGAVLAFEIARQLRNRGDEVATLCMIDAAFPGQFDEQLKDPDTALLLFVDVMRAAGMRLPADTHAFAEGLAALPTVGEKLDWLVDRLRTEGYGADTELEQWAAYFKVFSTNLTAHNEFRPRRYQGDVTYVEGLDGGSGDSAQHWAAVIGGRMSGHTVEARHYDILRSPHVTLTATIMDDLLGVAG